MNLKQQSEMITVSVQQGDKHLHVVVNDIVAVNPHVIRVSLYTYNKEDNSSVPQDYELAIGAMEFTTQEQDGSVGIDLAKLQQLLSQKIIESRNMANLAAALMNVEMEWDLEVENQPLTEEKDTKEGMSLAYGGETEANELTNS